MSTILLTVQSVNGRNVTSYTKAFNTEKIVEAYDNASTNPWDGATILSYQEIEESANKDMYGVSQYLTYINTMLNPDENIAYAELTLSNADITSLNGTPIEVIASAGAGKYISIVSAVFELDYGGAAITGNTTIDLVTGTTGTIVANAATALGGTADKVTRFVPVAGEIQANEGIKVKVNSGAPTMNASTSTAVLKVKYTTI